MDPKESRYTNFVLYLKHLDDSGQRLRPYTGTISANYDDYIKRARKFDADSKSEAELLSSIIHDAFQCGYRIGPYLQVLKQHCRKNNI
ncbi:MAG: hypothetical protein V1729_05960 [Candidatus Woesearchaeota archaeon]